MSFFIFPQEWITPAIAAAAIAFGPVDAEDVHIKYRHLEGQSLGTFRMPDKIIIDKRPKREWPREKAQCVMVHEYGHLAGFTDKSNKEDPSHSDNPKSIMYPQLRYRVCHRWLVRHGIK